MIMSLQSFIHYCDVIMSPTASQITSLTVVYSILYSGTDQRKPQSSASLAFVRGIQRWPVNSPHKCQVTRKMFPFDDVIMSDKTETVSDNTQLSIVWSLWALSKSFGRNVISLDVLQHLDYTHLTVERYSIQLTNSITSNNSAYVFKVFNIQLEKSRF